VSTTNQKQLVLILARAFASNLSTPTLLADDRGYLVYYNEAAEAAVGKRFSEFGEMPLDEWLEPFAPRSSTGELLPREQRPTWIALHDRRPAHLSYMVTSADGVEREIEVTAFPLFAHADEFVGAAVLFWRRLPWLSA
jgi:PAS domain-containing protein